MLILKRWMLHKVITEWILILINISGSDGYQSCEESGRHDNTISEDKSDC